MSNKDKTTALFTCGQINHGSDGMTIFLECDPVPEDAPGGGFTDGRVILVTRHPHIADAFLVGKTYRVDIQESTT